MEPVPHKLPPANVEKLVERHPHLFDETAKRPRIDIGIGWERLVDRLFTHLEALWSRRSKCVVEYVNEYGGRLSASVRPYRQEDRPAVDQAVLLAHFRAFYICDECGQPGEFRKTIDGWVACRCVFHQTPELMAGRLLYDDALRPTKLTTKGWIRYNPKADSIEPMSDDEVRRVGLRSYLGVHVDDAVLGIGWYHEDDFEGVKRILKSL